MTAPIISENGDSRLPSDCRVTELGIASLIMSAALFLASPRTMVLAALVWRFADTNPGVVLLHAWMARAGVLVGSLVGFASIAFGVQGIVLARRQRRFSATALAGLLLALAASAAWLLASIGLLNTTESLLHLHGR
jgi:hypothetical protein